MGTVVFPDAALKVFLTAGAAERAERRHKQLISKGIAANIAALRADLEARDARDRNRSASPLAPAEGALMLDNSALSIDDSVAAVLEAWQQRRPFDPMV
jgi:3-phosphoshikimate 1-carboxyvinyltransferase